ncbi:hypothetical protein GCM10010912_16870 [Paenibacillus albidus]|uniref:Uncharacterized protein n=1 Tax=Paenibacillus albidus TaxID=2041023 RepID=A0A917FFA3_9BACL|nr:hypothetical protein GCM10010912_16870 [Paenibacillus albidus]
MTEITADHIRGIRVKVVNNNMNNKMLIRGTNAGNSRSFLRKKLCKSINKIINSAGKIISEGLNLNRAQVMK